MLYIYNFYKYKVKKKFKIVIIRVLRYNINLFVDVLMMIESSLI